VSKPRTKQGMIGGLLTEDNDRDVDGTKNPKLVGFLEESIFTLEQVRSDSTNLALACAISGL
jgi:hypothetical protein